MVPIFIMGKTWAFFAIMRQKVSVTRESADCSQILQEKTTNFGKKLNISQESSYERRAGVDEVRLFFEVSRM